MVCNTSIHRFKSGLRLSEGPQKCNVSGVFSCPENLCVTNLYIAETYVKYSVFLNFRGISLHRYFLHDKIKIDGLTLFDDDLMSRVFDKNIKAVDEKIY